MKKKEFSLAHLTAISTTPLELVRIAANTGYDYVSLRQIYMGTSTEVPVDLNKDRKMYQEIKAIFRDTGLKLLDIELAKIYDGVDLKKYESAFEIGKSLGAKHVLSSIWTNNKDYGIEKFIELCDLANKYGLTVDLEAVPIAGVKSFEKVAEILRIIDKKNAGLMMDIHHFHRAQDKIDFLKNCPKEWFNYAQICDACGKIPENEDEMIFIMREKRDYLGEGGINIAEILNEMPIVPYSIELPNTLYSKEFGYEGHAKKCLETAKAYCEKFVNGRK
ncbi:MAG: TIM barrel protein [Fusobacterium gastrosuis]|uniref:sugar phosphate isomerase/epimerase family protein n=1 Tax=Fusobacterium gastrosuis TaxID=1755100 RepID=UPI002A8E090F|nr:TIM barrel protein [Fusobacterium gastrosuis]